MNREQLLSYLNESTENRNEFVRALLASSLNQQIRGLMASRGWSQADLSQHSGVSAGRISELLNGKMLEASITTLQKIAGAFDVALEVRFCSFADLLHWADLLNAVVPLAFEAES